MADTSPPERATPERIGRYELRFELASGGMGSVYLARLDGTAGFEKLVALKRIHPHLAREADCIEMFLDEAKIASRITHPNVCSVFDFGQADGEYYIAMEYLVGEPLARLFTRVAKIPEQRRSPLLPLRMARIIADACEGLHAAHELKDSNGDLLNVVHRDVSPRNLFITYDGAVQLVDFGVASARERLHKTSTGDVKGTIAYMAPEQLKAGTIDRRIDTWALGAALWEALAVKRLFKRDTTANTMFALLYEDIAPPSKFRPQVPKELDEIALKALARNPDERWQSAREMGQALRRFLSTQDELIGPAELSDWMSELFPQGEARKNQLMELARMQRSPVLSIRVTDEFEMTQAATVAEKPPMAPKSRPSRRMFVALLAGLVAIGGAGAAALYFGSSEQDAEPAPAARAEASPVKTAPAPEPRPAPEPEVAPAAPQARATPTAPEPVPAAPEREAAPTAPEPVDETPAALPSVGSKTKAAAPARRRRPRAKQQASGKPGTVNLVTRGGWAEVFKDGKSLGSTPKRLTLPAGRHKLVLRRSGTGPPKRIFVNVKADTTRQVSIDLN
ncbi:MAG: protein kinase [Myxococcales bacterium]|nr:protein kinase [Deltaproteobacteria bacterium]NNL24288.1 protein kinase [Myxococcales bacterium]